MIASYSTAQSHSDRPNWLSRETDLPASPSCKAIAVRQVAHWVILQESRWAAIWQS